MMHNVDDRVATAIEQQMESEINLAEVHMGVTASQFNQLS